MSAEFILLLWLVMGLLALLFLMVEDPPYDISPRQWVVVVSILGILVGMTVGSLESFAHKAGWF